MERSKIILFCLFVLFATNYGQRGYIEYDHPVTEFLYRMSALNYIEYDDFIQPLSRGKLGNLLNDVQAQKEKLNRVDRKRLEEYLTEFAFEVSGSVKSYNSIIGKGSLDKIFENETYLYADKIDDMAFFARLSGDSEILYDKNTEITTLLSAGASLRASYKNLFSFYVKASNGYFSGNRALALEKDYLKYNYKFNEAPDADVNSVFFDQTSGYFDIGNDVITFKAGNDRITLGRGIHSVLMDRFIPPPAYISLEISKSFFSFSHVHGKLLNEIDYIDIDSLSKAKIADDKYFVFHRFGFNFSKHFSLGLGEATIYANRSFDLSYFNPFVFYKSIEHANRDKDNSIVFIDALNNSIRGLKLHGIIMVDDLDFSRLGTSYHINKMLASAGADYEFDVAEYPASLKAQYIRIDPYFYSHWSGNNPFTSFDISFNGFQPNSEVISLAGTILPHHRIKVYAQFDYITHGKNKTDDRGRIIANYGGDILTGYRKGDPEDAAFLSGELERSSVFYLQTTVEPVNNLFITAYYNAENGDIRDYFITGVKIILNL